MNSECIAREIVSIVKRIAASDVQRLYAVLSTGRVSLKWKRVFSDGKTADFISAVSGDVLAMARYDSDAIPKQLRLSGLEQYAEILLDSTDPTLKVGGGLGLITMEMGGRIDASGIVRWHGGEGLDKIVGILEEFGFRKDR
jgi:hypothetical protein